VSEETGETLLHLSCARGNYTTSLLLVRRKADVNAVDNHGDTPLHVASRGRHWYSVPTVAHPRSPLQSDLTMHMCASRDVAEMLVDKGADDERRNKDGLTANDMGLREARRQADLEDDKMAEARQVTLISPLFPGTDPSSFPFFPPLNFLAHPLTHLAVPSPPFTEAPLQQGPRHPLLCIATCALALQQAFQCALLLQMMA